MKAARGGERGVALVLVLWLIVVLGAVAAAVVGSTRRESQVLLNVRARTVARYAAESGIVAGEALLQQRMGSAYSPAEQVLAMQALERDVADLGEVRLGKALFGVTLTNLSAKVDLNEADPETVVNLLSQFTSAEAASAVGDALLDWRDPDDLVRPQGAEKETYQRVGSPYVPRNAMLTRVDEFRRIHGVSEALARDVEPFITVNGSLRIDVNAAPEEVLAAIPGVGPGGAQTLITRRSDGPFTSIGQVQALLRPQDGQRPVVQRPQFAVVPSRLLLTSRGWVPGHPLTHEIQAVYAVTRRQVTLLSWRERDL